MVLVSVNSTKKGAPPLENVGTVVPLTRGHDSRFYGLDIPSATSTKESPRIDKREPVEYKNVV